MSALTRRRGTLTSAALAMFCIQLDFFALRLALPDMARSFSASPESAQWALSGYMLSLGALFIVAGGSAISSAVAGRSCSDAFCSPRP